ncbi:MAG: hypothetical protein HYT77_04940 [Deltaproteobacteria bacterium]|nr:hypothetical protein [Deltaproteobacteria bacterium]
MNRLTGVIAVGLLLLGQIWGCSTGVKESEEATETGTGTGSTTGTGAEVGTGSTLVVNDLSVLPSLSAVSSSSDVTASLSALKAKNAEVGRNSSAGCMAVNFFKPQILDRMKQADMFRSYLETTQDTVNSDSNSENDLDVPTDQYGYYQVRLGASEYIRVRLGNFVSGSSTSFKMDVCNSSNGTTYSRGTEFSVTGDASNYLWSGYVRDRFTFSETNKGFDATIFSIRMKDQNSMQEEFSFANLCTTASCQPAIDITSYFGDVPTTSDVESSTTYYSVFRLGFNYNAATNRNVTIGTFLNPSTEVNGLLCAEFDDTEGAGLMKYTVMGDIIFNETEGFSLANLSSPKVVSTDGIDFYGDFACNSLPDAVTVASVNENTAFDSSWDCEAPSGTAFTEIDGSQISYAEAEGIVEDVKSEASSDSGTCMTEEGVGGDERSENCILPTSFTKTMTGYSTTCPESPTGPWGAPQLSSSVHTITNSSDSQVVTSTRVDGVPGQSITFTRSGNSLTFPHDAGQMTVNACTLSSSSYLYIEFSCPSDGTAATSCSVRENYTTRTAVSGASCSTNTGAATPVIGTGASSCRETYTTSCTVN